MKRIVPILFQLLACFLTLASYCISGEDDSIKNEIIVPAHGPSSGGTEVTLIGENIDKIEYLLFEDIIIKEFDRKKNIINFKTKELPFNIINPLPLKIKLAIEKESKLIIISTDKEFTYNPTPKVFDIDLGVISIPTMETIGYPALLYSVNPFGNKYNYIISPRNLKDFRNSFSISLGFIIRVFPRYPYKKTATRLIKQDLVPTIGFGYKISNWARFVWVHQYLQE